jgi:hypothetical protein
MNWRESGGDEEDRREIDEMKDGLEGEWRRRRRKKRSHYRNR